VGSRRDHVFRYYKFTTNTNSTERNKQYGKIKKGYSTGNYPRMH
jgi:hypothetical protein